MSRAVKHWGLVAPPGRVSPAFALAAVEPRARWTPEPRTREIAGIYRKRALFQAEKIRLFLPNIFLFAIGMSATLLYGLTLFVPFTSLLEGLAVP